MPDEKKKGRFGMYAVGGSPYVQRALWIMGDYYADTYVSFVYGKQATNPVGITASVEKVAVTDM